MGNKLLSVIIPSYNMQDYLHRSVDSLLNNQVMDDIEIVIVNDGSTDATSAIANAYQEEYPNSIVVVDKQNGHYGSAVNAGIQIATGRYLKVLDADDWFDNSEFVKYVKQLAAIETVDVVFTHWTLRNVNTQQSISSKRHGYPYNVKLQVDSLALNFEPNYFYSLYGLTYRTQFLKDIGYKQTEGVCYTDTEYAYYPMMKAQTVTFIDAEVYQYYVGREGQSVDPSVKQKNISHYYKILQRLIATYEIPATPTRKAIQLHAYDLIAGSLYFLCLSFDAYENTRKYQLKEVDNKLKNTSDIVYKMLNHKAYCKIPYVRLWRLFGLNFELLYKLLSKLKMR